VKYIEVEQKFAVPDIDQLHKKLAELGATPMPQTSQVDTYYNAPHRDFLEPESVSEWLRVRRQDRGASLNYKRWLPLDAPVKTHCDEYETPIDDAEALTRTLTALDFTPMITVEKRRQEWRMDGDVPVLVAIDTIDALGTFVEFEFKGDAGTTDEAIEQLDRFVASLELPLGERVHRGYPHLLLAGIVDRADTTPQPGFGVEQSSHAEPTVWRMHLQTPYAALIAAGSKTLEVRAAYASRRDLKPGDLIRFHTDNCAHADILTQVSRVTVYPNAKQLIDNEDPATIAGPSATREDIAALLHTIYPEPPPGYLAIQISVIDRGATTREPATSTHSHRSIAPDPAVRSARDGGISAQQ
jgi:adenylate cyclase class 2